MNVFDTEPLIAVDVFGKPAPQGGIRSLGKGRPSVHANADTLLPWRDSIVSACRLAMQAMTPEQRARLPYDGPVALFAYFTWPKPVSAPKTRETWPTARPDLSHLVRAAEDALTSAGVWRDDSLIVYTESRKVYPNQGPGLASPGAKLFVYRFPFD